MKYIFYSIILFTLFCGILTAQTDEGSSGFDNGFFIRSADSSFVFRPFGLIHTDLRVIKVCKLILMKLNLQHFL